MRLRSIVVRKKRGFTARPCTTVREAKSVRKLVDFITMVRKVHCIGYPS